MMNSSTRGEQRVAVAAAAAFPGTTTNTSILTFFHSERPSERFILKASLKPDFANTNEDIDQVDDCVSVALHYGLT
jgi:hypothetical protein